METNVLRTHFVLSAHAYPGPILGCGSIVGHGRFVRAENSVAHGRVYGHERYSGIGASTGEYSM